MRAAGKGKLEMLLESALESVLGEKPPGGCSVIIMCDVPPCPCG